MRTRLQQHNGSILGNGKDIILFLHGFGCNKSMWRFVIPDFMDTYTVVTLDLIGSGNSDISSYNFDKYSNLSGHADDILELCDEQMWKSVHIVGHSVSSMIGVMAAIKRPDLVASLILVGPSPCYVNKENYYGGFSESDIMELLDNMDSNYLGWSSAITPVIMDNPDRPELTEELKNSFCRTDPTIAKHFGRVTFLSDNRADLSRVRVPTLIIQSAVDTIAPVEVGRYVAEHIINSQLTILPTVGHCPHLSHPNETTKAIKDFISNVTHMQF